MPLTKDQQQAKQIVQESQLQASISPVTHPAHPSASNKKDKQQFAAYKNFVRNIQIQQKFQPQNPDSLIELGSKKVQNEPKNTKPPTKDKSLNEFKFTDFIAKKLSPRNTKTASWSNMKTTKTQQFKISHIPTATKLTAQSQKRNNSPQELKGKPYVEKKLKKQLVLKQQKQSELIPQTKMVHQIKLRVQKLPELKPQTSHYSKKKEMDNIKIEEFKDIEAIIKKKKVQNIKNDLSLSPILKTYDPRYFGLESKSTNFQKMGKQFLNEIKTKYWCYDKIENQEVYENFEFFLCSDLKNK